LVDGDDEADAYKRPWKRGDFKVLEAGPTRFFENQPLNEQLCANR